eukprot:CAMPEP_0179090312 /NCGR_PEP_ID=MMETSP0796-20121207/41196_1 /TAXON_ID=73915 /ORGANISM="Pyrodinium bahamense, Strain pbaha01" /LENGTH=36 /DNA_ID= /DNA_START= /DNA_END= /DNA_ORIENTATION=
MAMSLESSPDAHPASRESFPLDLSTYKEISVDPWAA